MVVYVMIILNKIIGVVIMANTLLVVGGNQDKTFKKMGGRFELKVLHHPGESKKSGNKKEYQTLINKADCVVVLKGAINRKSMIMVKEICKEQNKTIVYHQGRGVTGAIQSSLAYFEGLSA